MRSLYYPASRPIARGKDFLLFLLSTAANMWDVVASLDLLVCWCPIIARVQTEMLRPLLGWLGTGNDDAIQGRAQQFHIVAIGSVNDHGQGNASPISQETALGAFLTAIGRIGSGCGFSQRSFCHCSIYSLPLPLDSFQLIIHL